MLGALHGLEQTARLVRIGARRRRRRGRAHADHTPAGLMHHRRRRWDGRRGRGRRLVRDRRRGRGRRGQARTGFRQTLRDRRDPRLGAHRQVLEERIGRLLREQATQRVIGAHEARLTVAALTAHGQVTDHQIERRSGERAIERRGELLNGQVDHAARPSRPVM
jgi:hypothetical protein